MYDLYNHNFDVFMQWIFLIVVMGKDWHTNNIRLRFEWKPCVFFLFFIFLSSCVSTCMLNVTLIDWRFISNTDLFALRNLKIFQLSTHIHIKLGSMHSLSDRAEPSQALHVFDRLKRIFRKRCVLNKTNTVKSLIENPITIRMESPLLFSASLSLLFCNLQWWSSSSSVLH